MNSMVVVQALNDWQFSLCNSFSGFWSFPPILFCGSRMLSRALKKSLSCGNPVVAGFTGSYCSRLCFHQSAVCKVASQAECGFKPAKVAVVTKTTRYEFEQQRYRYAGLSEEDFKQLVSRHLWWGEYTCLSDTPLYLVSAFQAGAV